MKYRWNSKKALEVILWFAEREPGIDVHRVLKLLFFADKKHLNEFGRPIVGDNYCALPFGPTGMGTYDILERKPGMRVPAGIREDEDYPFQVRSGRRKKHIHATRPPETRKLSESDRDSLDWAYRTYGHLDFNTLKRLSHEHPAWKKGSQREGKHMDYADFLEGENAQPDRVDEFEELAVHLKC